MHCSTPASHQATVGKVLFPCGIWGPLRHPSELGTLQCVTSGGKPHGGSACLEEPFPFHLCIRCSKEKLFHCGGAQTLEEVVQRGCGVLAVEILQSCLDRALRQCADPTLAEALGDVICRGAFQPQQFQDSVKCRAQGAAAIPGNSGFPLGQHTGTLN